MSLKYLLVLTAAVQTFAAACFASSVPPIVVYGDSLSDNGNLYAATGLPGAPYYMGRRSNGPVAVEQLASLVGATLKDFAWIGATTGVGNFADKGTPTSFGVHNLPGMQTELQLYKSQIAPNIGGLFVVWGGPDDFLVPSPLDPTPAQQIGRAVGDLVGIAKTLQGDGAKHILLPGMPDLGLTPYYRSLGPVAAAEATALTNAFNAALLAELPSGVQYFDTATLLRSIVNDPSAYGFSDVTDACYNGAATVCADPSKYLFFDSFHPTTQADAFLAQGFANTAIPEPGTPIAVALGLIIVFSIRQRAAVRCSQEPPDSPPLALLRFGADHRA